MSEIGFDWNSRKASENERKHGVTFEEAKSAFLDENARLIPDPEHSADEDRFILLGLSIQLRFLLICHSYREDDEVIRIISARKADRSERKQYAEYLL
jgi:uncharacterized DUF497 family protein